MPPVFTKAFAERLDRCCSVRVKEAENGMPPAGRVLLAPGLHMTVSKFGSEPHVALNQNEDVNGHRPSVDVLMHPVAREYDSRALGVIMIGMEKTAHEAFASCTGARDEWSPRTRRPR